MSRASVARRTRRIGNSNETPGRRSKSWASDRADTDEQTPPEKPLPRAIGRRIVSLPPHIRALRENLERIGLDDYRRGLESRTTDALNEYVYPLERPFEIVDNFVLELADEGLAAAGKATGPSGSDDLRRLRDNGVISAGRCQRLIEINRIRNDAQHEYVDFDPRVFYEAASRLPDEAIGFLQDLVEWLRKLGFGLPARS